MKNVVTAPSSQADRRRRWVRWWARRWSRTCRRSCCRGGTARDQRRQGDHPRARAAADEERVHRPAPARHGRRVRHALGVDVRAHRDGARPAPRAVHQPRAAAWDDGRSRTTCRATPSSRNLIAKQAEGRDDCWILACDDPYLPIFYGTVNIWTFLGRPDTRWISVALNQCCTTEDFLLFGELIGDAIAQSDRRVVLLASRRDDPPVLRLQRAPPAREPKAPDNIYDRAYYDADMQVLEKLQTGDHAGGDRGHAELPQGRTRKGISGTT